MTARLAELLAAGALLAFMAGFPLWILERATA